MTISADPETQFDAQVDPDFRKLLASYEEANLRTFTGTVYGVWADYRLAYMNSAWFEFAEENGGEPIISRDWGLGRRIFDAMIPEVRAIYEIRYDYCLRYSEVWKHEYECSSALNYRWFHQIVYPLGRGEGLLVANALALERPHNPRLRPARIADESAYRDAAGVLHQCCHCRKVRNLAEPGRWDWIREWVRLTPGKTDHTFCPTCYGYYYSLLE